MASNAKTEEKPAADAAPPAKKKSMMPLILAVVGLLLGVGAGGGGVWFWLNSAKHKAEEEAEAKAKAAEPVVKQYYYVPIDGLNVPVPEDGGVALYLFDLSLETDSVDNQILISSQLPRLRDALLREANKENFFTGEGATKIDFDAVSKRLTDRANQVLGKPVVTHVMFKRWVRAQS